MLRQTGGGTLSGRFYLPHIGPFYPTLEWPFSPDPNTSYRYAVHNFEVNCVLAPDLHESQFLMLAS